MSNGQPAIAKTFFIGNIFVTGLLALFYFFHFSNYIDFNQSQLFNRFIGIFVLPSVTVPFYTAIMQKYETSAPVRRFTNYNLVWSLCLCLLIFANEFKLLSASGYLKDAREKNIAKVEVLSPYEMIMIAKKSYQNWLLLQRASPLPEDNNLLNEFYHEKAAITIKIISHKPTIQSSFKKGETSENSLIYYFTHIRNGTMFPILLSQEQPENLFEARRKPVFGVTVPTASEQYELDFHNKTVCVKGVYILSIPNDVDSHSQREATMPYDEVLIDMDIRINSENGAEIRRELREYRIGISDFSADPDETLKKLDEDL